MLRLISVVRTGSMSVFLASILFFLIGQAHGSAGPELAARLDQTIDTALEQGKIVGTVVLVLQDGAVVYHRAAGWADRETRQPMREDTIFRFASLSKPIVSLALMRLVEAGTLRLDDPVTKYLPDFKPKLADGSTPVITLEQLLTHTAGLSSDFLKQQDIPIPGTAQTRLPSPTGSTILDELQRIQALGLGYEPGHGWAYSMGIDVLGVVMERATGMELPAVIKSLVTEPVGMVDTEFIPKDPSRVAIPYGDGQPPIRMTDPYLAPFPGHFGILFSPGRIFDTSFAPAAGSGMSGTATDLARLLERIRTGGGGLIQPATAQSMMENHIGNRITMNGPGWGFGYGGAVVTNQRVAGTPQSDGTWTWGGVWGHNWFVDPQYNMVVISLTNTANEGVSGRYPTAIRNAVYGRSTPPPLAQEQGD